MARTRVENVDLREQILDVAGQEIMTADKVTLRLNAVVAFEVVDPQKALTATGNHVQALYREAQLALRACVGTRDLDALLGDQGRRRPGGRRRHPGPDRTLRPEARSFRNP